KPVKKLALYLAAKCAWQTGVHEQTQIAPAVTARIRDYYVQLVGEPDLPKNWYWEMISIALESKNFALAKQIGLVYGQRHPEDRAWRYHLGRAEYQQGNYFSALRLFNEFMENNPPEDLAKGVKTEYETIKEKCREQAKQLLGP